MNNLNYFLKFKGRANIPVPLGIGHNFNVTADCSITEEKKIDNENGEFDVIYTVQPINVSIGKDNGPIIKAKDPRKNSVRFRNYLYKIYIEEGILHDFDTFYDEVISTSLSHMHSLVEEANKRLNDK